MILETGLTTVNKTFTYLLPILRFYGSEFTNKLNGVFKLGVGVYDDRAINLLKDQKNIFILVCKTSTKYVPFQSFNSFITEHESFVTSYYDPENDNRVMYVLKMPKEYEETYDLFLSGKYSKMFEDEEEARIFYPKGIADHAFHVCSKSEHLKKAFIAKNNRDFKVKISDFNIRDSEYEYPPLVKEEVFNTDRESLYF